MFKVTWSIFLVSKRPGSAESICEISKLMALSSKDKAKI